MAGKGERKSRKEMKLKNLYKMYNTELGDSESNSVVLLKFKCKHCGLVFIATDNKAYCSDDCEFFASRPPRGEKSERNPT